MSFEGFNRHAPGSSLLGTRWRAKEPNGSPYDDVQISGFYDLGNDAGGFELVIRPVQFAPVLTCDAESFQEAYAPVSEELERLDARLAALTGTKT
jgi:hypothetical protein